jgi:uncharacterized protein YdeI (YjbR/CyaY-like superfamily)
MPEQRVTPRSRQAWRRWLEANHGTQAEIWLVFWKRHTGRATLTYGEAVEEALCFGWIDGVRRSIDAKRYMHRFSPRRLASRWSPTNRKRAERMQAAGLMVAAGRQAIEAARRNGTWDAPVSAPAIDLSMPPELEARLRRNKRARAFFESLAPSYQRQFCGWINAAKRSTTKQRRVDEAVALLARGEKLGLR